MIPTVVFIALAGALVLPRHPVGVGVVSTLAWALIVLVEGSADSATAVIASLAAGAANAAAVVVPVWIVRTAVDEARAGAG